MRYVDVALVVKLKDGLAALNRILDERLHDDDHDYSPTVPPIILQCALDNRLYNFQRHDHNGRNGAPRDGAKGWGNIVINRDGGFSVQPKRFISIKAARAFVNDRIDSLYLASHLWGRTFANMARPEIGVKESLLEFTSDELTARLVLEHGPGSVRKRVVVEALNTLTAAGMARQVGVSKWEIRWRRLPKKSGNLAEVIAEKACRGTVAKVASPESVPPPDRPPTLFDEI